MDLYDSWKIEHKVGAHQIMAVLSSYHTGQITGPEAVAIMDFWELDPEAQADMVTLYDLLVLGTITRPDLDNALMLGDVGAPGFSTKAEFIGKLGL